MFAGSRFTVLAVEIFILLDVVRSETDAEEMKPQLTLVTLDPVNLNMIGQIIRMLSCDWSD